jgi:hypothetical protein
MKILSILLTSLFFSVPAFADHAVDNAAETARASYRAADDAEALAYAANRDAGWHRDGIIESVDVESGVTPEDHRSDTLRSVARVADRLHYALSDLYRSARYASGGFGPEDHRGDRIRDDFSKSQSYFYELQRTYRNLSPYQYNRRIDSLYRSMEYTFSRLAWTVQGGIRG